MDDISTEQEQLNTTVDEQSNNVDVTMIAQRPKLRPYIDRMRENIAIHLGIDPARVNVKATTEEHLGFTGEGKGMACHAVCLLEEK